MWDVSKGLGEAFGDVESYFAQCKFNNCRHQTEPGCAVRAALESGELPRERWENYQQLKRESKYSGDKAGYLRQKQQWQKEISMWSKHHKK
jgi:ribosome biogenesis GTPase